MARTIDMPPLRESDWTWIRATAHQMKSGELRGEGFWVAAQDIAETLEGRPGPRVERCLAWLEDITDRRRRGHWMAYARSEGLA